MNTAPKVSVIVPLYNAERYLRECLDSIVNQTLREIEIICVDDGSTDESPRILAAYSERDERIRFMRQPNSGSGPARNKGILAAKGAYIAFMDADDLYPESTTLEKLYQTAAEKDVMICGGSLYRLRDGVIIKDFQGLESQYIFREEGEILYKDYQFDFGFYRFIYKRTFLLENNILFPSYLRFQDPPFFVRAMLAAQRFYAIRDVTYLHRHSHFDANERKVTDMILGITEVIQLAKENDLQKLYETTIKRCCGRFYFSMLTAAERFESEEAHKALRKLNESIDLDRFNGIDSELYKLHLLACKTGADADKIRASVSYRIGRAVTWLPRMMVGLYGAFRKKALRKLQGRKSI